MEKLCEAAGVVNMDSSLTKVDRGSVMRIRVRVDVTLPLNRGRIFSLDNGSKEWVSFKYEQLPNVCYWCGRLNHFDKDCDRWIQSSGTLTQKDQEYGPWLRAFPLPLLNTAMIVVPRYFETKKKELDTGRQGKKKPLLNLEKHMGALTRRSKGELTVVVQWTASSKNLILQ